MSISLIDILFVVTVVLLVFNGLSNGAVASLINLVSIPVAFVVAYLFGPHLTLLLAANSLPVTPLIAYVVLFCGTILILHIISTFARGVVTNLPLIGLGDRLIGAVVGFVEAWLLWLVLLFILHNFLQNINNYPGVIAAAQFSSWQQFYNDAVAHSLFASVNSIIVARIPVHR
jgi:uncharacterized membrane protein required for colicin V production